MTDAIHTEVPEVASRRDFDDEFYLETYPDVAAAIEGGLFASAKQHYLERGAAEGRAAVRTWKEPVTDLLAPVTTETVYLELTSRCNLRCTYCAVSQPTYVGSDLPLERFEGFLEEMRARRVRIIVMNGHGESSIVSGWDALSDRLADAGFQLHITTNLAKRLKPEEISALSRFEKIYVSLDTIDPELCAQLRRGARLETIYENLAAIRAHAAARRRTPEIGVSVVVSDQSAPGLAALIEGMWERGATVFRFGDLAEYPPIEGTLTARHLSALPPDVLAETARDFRTAITILESKGGTHFIDPPIASILLDSNGPAVERAVRKPVSIQEKTVHHDHVSPGETRDCLDPWKIAFVHATGEVRPCCFFEEMLGGLAEDSLTAIYEGEEFRKLRQELLSGNLRPNCANCAGRPLIATEVLEEKVRAFREAEQE
ncbi:MAG: radical SAM/SPASM domain-containing protein [Thermoanaerobaculia bacterium]